MSHPVILSLGSINADFTFEVGGDLGRGGTLRANTFTRRAGGKAANVAMFAHRIGVAARLLGRVGEDQLAQHALEPLSAAGLDLEAVTTATGANTGIAMIAVPEDGEKTILLAPNANMEWDGKALDALAAAIGRAPDGCVLAADYEVPHHALALAFEMANQRQIPIVVDPSFADLIQPCDLNRLHAVSPNMQEAGTILGRELESDADAREAAQELADAGVRIACVKLKQGGCIVASDGQVARVSAPQVEVVDKTGAGDAFTAALVVAIAEGRQGIEAAAWGVAGSTLAVTGKGSQESYPNRKQFDRMLAEVLRSIDA